MPVRVHFKNKSKTEREGRVLFDNLENFDEVAMLTEIAQKVLKNTLKRWDQEKGVGSRGQIFKWAKPLKKNPKIKLPFHGGKTLREVYLQNNWSLKTMQRTGKYKRTVASSLNVDRKKKTVTIGVNSNQPKFLDGGLTSIGYPELHQTGTNKMPARPVWAANGLAVTDRQDANKIVAKHLRKHASNKKKTKKKKSRV